MSHKLQFRALLGLVVVITILVGVLVWPAPKEAKAVDTSAIMVLNWNGFTPSDCDVTAQLLDLELNVLQTKDMSVGSGYHYWTCYFAENEDAEFVRFNWNVGEGGENIWTDNQNGGTIYPPVTVQISGSGLAFQDAWVH